MTDPAMSILKTRVRNVRGYLAPRRKSMRIDDLHHLHGREKALLELFRRTANS